MIKQITKRYLTQFDLFNHAALEIGYTAKQTSNNEERSRFINFWKVAQMSLYYLSEKKHKVSQSISKNWYYQK